MNKRKVLITGGAGFIGSNLVDALIEEGNDVVIIDNLSTGAFENINSKAKFYELDICDSKISDVFNEEKPEVVFHLAAQIDVRKSLEDPVSDAKQNILGSINLLENCKNNKVKKFIFSSTGGAIYGDTNQIPTTEDHPTNPISPYGIAKLSTEKYLYYYNKIFGLPYIVLRYSNVYGPRQNFKGEAGVVAIFCNKLINGDPLIINGDGKQTRDFVFVKDVVAANLAALEFDKIGIYNISTGIETNINQLAEILIKHHTSNTEILHTEAKNGEQQRSCISFEKAKADLGFNLNYDFIQGIKQTLDWFLKK